MEELNKALATLITQATQGVEAGVGFLQAELPEVVEQLLMWHFTISLLWFIAACVIAIVLITIDVIIGYRLYKEGEVTDALFDYIFFGSVVRVIAALLLISLGSLEWLQIYIAPKVWLLEYSATLIK